ncbi:MFS transporter [Euryarchaeota archaeon]|nr:MFS transporter [Euryarchaeota archaeon]MDC0655993.1 MFS transporter [Candidatus Poseidoniaceae archaeon]MDA8610153.1 MFS transporter [Euryarchaeota archaeon]MDA8689880.1 MFS transporter [Euryarchaeota archaeon]MDA8790540.1 MFS transporter [Euryarchaeota archaeon]
MSDVGTATETEPFSVTEAMNSMSDADKKSLKSWYFFDWANQAYALTVMTVIAPQVMSGLYNYATGKQTGDAFYAQVLTISMLFVVLTAPALGVIADRMPIKKKLLKWYTLAGVVFTALMGAAPYFGSEGYKIMAVMYVIGTVGFTGGNVIYYSFMPYLAEKRCMDHVSSKGYAYGFMGGSMLLIFHLVLLLGPFGWDNNFRLSAIFVTSALWWWGFGYLMFKWTPEPEIPSNMEWEGVVSAAKVAYGQVFTTFKEIKRFKILAMYLLAYLLFYDGVNTIASMASAYGDSVLRLSLQLNIYLLLTVNIVAIPMTLLFGKLANAKGTKFALMLSLVIYCCVAVVAAGFAPLELDSTVDDKGVAEDAERYDFTFTWNETAQMYELTTLYDKGYEGWISEEGAGDNDFRDAYQQYFPEPDYSTESATSSIGTGILMCLAILAILGTFGAGILYIQNLEMGWKGALLAFLLVGSGLIGVSMLAEDQTVTEDSVPMINAENATAMVAAFDSVDDHRWAILFVGGPESGEDEIGDTHPTNVDQGGLADGYATWMRSNVWKPLGMGVTAQWISLGMFVGVAMGAAGAQARSMFSMLIPETRTSEFFGFFGFLGKSAAMIGTFLYAIASTQFDSRVAILTITIVILMGTFLTSRIDLEEGMRVAAEEDRLARENPDFMNAQND